MADLVGVFAVSHTPVMTNMPDAPGPALREAAFAHYRRVGEEISKLAPDTILLISDDHLHNFYLNNLPAFCIGVAQSYLSPVEDWLKITKQTLPGDAAFGTHLLNEVMAAGFDPALSMELTLDHGMMTPLDLAGVAGRHKIVPLLVNAVQPPLPAMRRCVDLGRAIRGAIASYPIGRIAVLATGGLSHDVGTPRMGAIAEVFDRAFLARLEAGGSHAAADYAADNVDAAGNGAEEVRNWLVAHGIAGAAKFETYYYRPMEQWYTGIALGRWRVQ